MGDIGGGGIYRFYPQKSPRKEVRLGVILGG